MARTKKSQVAAEDEAIDLTEAAEPMEEDMEEIDLTIEEPKKKKAKKEGYAAELPVTLTASAGKEGKQAVLVAVDEGFGGDTGAIGRLNFKSSGFTLDLRGREHDAAIKPSRTLCVVAVTGDEAKLEVVVSEYVELSNSRDALAAFGAVVEGEMDDDDRDVNAQRDEEEEKKKAPPKKKKKKPAKKKK